MKNLALLGALLASASFGLHEIAVSHGGTYRGPGDTVPPGGGGGPNGGGPPTPGPNGPTAPGPTQPTTPGRAGPPPPGNGPAQPTAPNTGGASPGVELTSWQFWWGFNKDPYLNLKAHVHGSTTITGSDDFFLGHGQDVRSRISYKPSAETLRTRVVPALLAALENETHNDIVTGAMIALAKIGDEPLEDGTSRFQQLITSFLKDANQEIAETAAVALGIHGDPSAVKDLGHLLMDTPSERMRLVGSEAGVNYRTRAFAAYGLGQIGHRTEDPDVRRDIVSTLWEVCESPRMSTRDVKVAAVIAMGLVPLDVEALDSALIRDEVYDGSTAPSNRREQLEYLIEFFQSENDKAKHHLVRAHAPRAMASLLGGAPDMKRTMVAALAPYVTKRGNVGVRELRQSAALAFGQLGDLDDDPEDALIRSSLIEASGNADIQVKHFCLMSLGQVGGRPGEGDAPLAGQQQVRDFLQRSLARGTAIRPWAGLAIGVMERGLQDANHEPSNAMLLALRQSLREAKSGSEVGAYAIACGIALDTDAEPLLIQKLDTMAEDEVRGHLAIGLGLMNARSALEPIQEVVQSSKYRGGLLKQAAIALGLLGDKDVVDSLVAQLEQAQTLSTQASIASALGFIGDSRSIEPLIALLEDDSTTGAARGFAAAALGIVADKEVLPWNAKFSVDINYRANTSTLTGGGGTGLLDIL